MVFDKKSKYKCTLDSNQKPDDPQSYMINSSFSFADMNQGSNFSILNEKQQ